MKKLMAGVVVFALALLLGVGMALVSADRAEAGSSECVPIDPPVVLIRDYAACDLDHDRLGDYVYICSGVHPVTGEYCDCVWDCVPSTEPIEGPPRP